MGAVGYVFLSYLLEMHGMSHAAPEVASAPWVCVCVRGGACSLTPPFAGRLLGVIWYRVCCAG